MLYSISLSPDPTWFVPTKTECYALWDKYEMLDNIREHSLMVAKTALYIARNAIMQKYDVSEDYIIAAALLHDIAKTYTIKHGGDHACLGAAFVRAETGNPYLAQAVLCHVSWPWLEGDLAIEHAPWRLPLVIAYADKRVCHDGIVSVDKRFHDLLERYGTTELKRKYIQENYEQSIELENSFKKHNMKVDFNTQDVNAVSFE